MRLLKLLEYFFFVRTLDFPKNIMLLFPLVDKDKHTSSLHLFCIMTGTFVKVPVTALLMQKERMCVFTHLKTENLFSVRHGKQYYRPLL